MDYCITDLIVWTEKRRLTARMKEVENRLCETDFESLAEVRAVEDELKACEEAIRALDKVDEMFSFLYPERY